jgi:transketolase
MRNAVAQSIYKYCSENKNGMLLSGDAGFGVWDQFKIDMPDQYLNTGINEAAEIGIAAGMSLSGHKVFVYNIIPFLLYRCYEQVRVDIGYQNLPVMLVGIGAGLTYAPAGMTHYSVEDIGLARTIPNMAIFSPADAVQAQAAFEYAAKLNTPSFIRLTKAGDPIVTQQKQFTPYYKLKDGSRETAIVFHGSMASNALEVHGKLKADGIDADLFSVLQLHPLDISFLSSYKNIFVIEEHFTSGGLGTIIKEANLGNIHTIALPNEYIHVIGNTEYVRKYYGLDSESIATTISNTIKGT